MDSRAKKDDDLFALASRNDNAGSPNPQRRLLPHNLEVSLKYLSDGELKYLADSVAKEVVRRRPTPCPMIDKTTQQQVPETQKRVEGLTLSQVNLIQESIKSGVKPSVLTRQFGITRAQIKAALQK
jgi:hypothetical protein